MEVKMEKTKRVDLKQHYIKIAVLIFKRLSENVFVLSRCSEVAEDLLKYDQEIALKRGIKVQEVFPGIFGEMLFERLKKGWNDDEGFTDSLDLKMVSGESLSLDLLFFKLDADFIQVSITDLNQTKKAYSALLENEKKYRNLFETTTKE